MPENPADVVARQVNAYNALDVEGFLACYHPDVVITELPGNRALANGVAELENLYRNVVEKSRNLRCEVFGRLPHGRFVADREIVTGLPAGRKHDAVVVYEVEGEAIRRVWIYRE